MKAMRKVLIRNLVLLAIFLYFLMLILLISYIQTNKCQSISIANNFASHQDGSDSYTFHYYTNLLCAGGMQTIENSLFEANFVNDRANPHTSSADKASSYSSSRDSREAGNGDLVDPKNSGSVLIDLRDFRYIINNDICGTKDIYMVTIVHTAPKHFKERQAIRSTWGKPDIFRHIPTKVAFLIADIALTPTSAKVSVSQALESKQRLQRRIEVENERYGDLVQGNFVDSYRNLTYKNIMGKKWVSEECPQARFVLKTDDDMFVDMFQLIEFLEDEYSVEGSQGAPNWKPSRLPTPHSQFSTGTGQNLDQMTRSQRSAGRVPADLLMCYVFAASPAVSDASHANAKWLVDKSEFGSDLYPPYCSGRAYVTTPALSGRIYRKSAGQRYFWIDDVYVTGILVRWLGVRHVEVNDLYNLYDPLVTMEWLANGPPEPLRFVFAYSENGHITFYKLWNKTVAEHGKLRKNYRKDILLQQVERRMASLIGLDSMTLDKDLVGLGPSSSRIERLVRKRNE